MHFDEGVIQTKIEALGLTCFGKLGHKRVKALFPTKAVSPDKHFEFDYFILYRDCCIIGELSGKGTEKGFKDKYVTFCEHVDLIKTSDDYPQLLSNFDIAPESKHLLKKVERIHAFIIAAEHERYDLDISELPEVPIIYRSDWAIIDGYAESIGQYGKYPFLKLIGIEPKVDLDRDLTFNSKKNLISSRGFFIFRNSNIRADIFTFSTNPKELLEVSEVFRRELTPVIGSSEDKMYQRPLDLTKLAEMRSLVHSSEFTFPNTILVALNGAYTRKVTDKNKDEDEEYTVLHVPMEYGAISIIDGQHRLFSYAGSEISDQTRSEARILVTGLCFDTSDAKEILYASASTFIEINQNQKKISSAHIDEIAYSVLGRDYPKALAAQVLLRANQRQKGTLHGMFDLRQTSGGLIKAATVIAILAPLTNKERIDKLLHSKRKTSLKRGYENLLTDTDGLTQSADTEVLITNTVIMVEIFFSKVKRVFPEDWEALGSTPLQTNLSYTKVFAAFVRLFRQIISEGLDEIDPVSNSRINSWKIFERELRNIRANVSKVREIPELGTIIFSNTDTKIPDDRPSAEATFKFLNANRKEPKSLQDIEAEATTSSS